MSLNNYIKISALSLICFLSSMPSASAQWPTLDMSAIGQDMKSITQQIEQYKTQLMESKTVGSINSAIGDAKSSMSKFSADDLEAAKKKAEKAKKAAEKAKKIQDDIKKAKEEYEEKKKQYEEYKQKLNEAKEMANDAKDVASSAGSLAGQATSDLKDKVSSVTGSGSSSSPSASSPVASQTSSSSTSSSSSVTAAVSSTASRNVSSVGVSTGASSPVLTKVTATPAAVTSPIKAQSGVSSLQPVSGNVSVSPTAAPVSASVSGLSAAPVSSVRAGTTVSTVKGRTAFSSALPTSEEVKELSIDENSEMPLSEEADDVVDQAQNAAAVQGSVAGVATLKGSLTKAINKGDIQTLDAVAKVDTADIITSDSKVYQPETTVKPISSSLSAAQPAPSVRSVPSQAVSSSVSVKSTQPSSVTSQPVSAQPAAPVGRKAFTTPAAASENVSGNMQLKTIQQPLAKESSLWLDDGDRARRNSVKLSYAETLVYGDAECEYKNFIVSADDGEIVVVPKTLAKECCLKAEELKDMNVIKDCANKLLAKMNDSDSTEAAAARGIFSQIVVEQSLYGLAESLDDTNASTSYLSDVLKQYKEDMKGASTTGDDISSVSMTNTQLLFLFNRIRRIYTSSLAATGIGSLDSIEASTLDEETDIGIGDIESEYEFSVTRNEVEYPIIPENMAKKCIIKFNEGIDKIKECYIDAVRSMHASDFKDAEVGRNYADNITYQNILDILAKSLYQRVKSAQYDEQLEKTKETNADATTIRTKSDGLFNTDYEIQEAIDDIVNMLASRVAHSSLTSLSKLNPLSTEQTSNSAQKEG